MKSIITERKTFTGESFSENIIARQVFDECVFRNCFFGSADLSGCTFNGATFEGCDLSSATVKNTVLSDCRFKECKLLAVDLYKASRMTSGLKFTGCIMDYCSFYGMSAAESVFEKCRLISVDFTEANIRNSLFGQSDLSGAVFNATDLRECDFRDSHNYFIDPRANKVAGAHFSSYGLAGLVLPLGIEID